jgi:hypothetical protein
MPSPRFRFGDRPVQPTVIVLFSRNELDSQLKQQLEALGARVVDVGHRDVALTMSHVRHALNGQGAASAVPPDGAELQRLARTEGAKL